MKGDYIMKIIAKIRIFFWYVIGTHTKKMKTFDKAADKINAIQTKEGVYYVSVLYLRSGV